MKRNVDLAEISDGKLYTENEKRISELQDNFRWPNICVIGVLKGKKMQEKHLKI